MSKIDKLLQGYKKGTYITLHTLKQAKVKKSCPYKIVKSSKYKNARLGISYDNMSQTQVLRNTDEIPKENAGLTWGEWKSFPYVIEHKGKDYLRCYVEIRNIETTWIKDGEVVNKADIEEYLLSSEKKKPKEGVDIVTLSIKEENLY